jgi:transposase-like protein
MALNFPQSLPEFQHRFPDEQSCAAYLEEMRWPKGFVCPACNQTAPAYRIAKREDVLQCRHCRKQTSLTAGTIMHRSHSPLRNWFWGAYLVTTHTPGISAVQFQRQIGLTRYETAFQMLHKLRAGMVRPDKDPIGAEWPVEIDETYVGGATKGEGRGVHHMATVVGAIEVRRKGKPTKAAQRRRGGKPIAGKVYAGRLRLRVVPERGKRTLEKFVTENVASAAYVITDGWQGYDHLNKMGYYHRQVVLNGDPALIEKELPMIHLVFSNLKTWIDGTHHGVSEQHLQAYLNEFVFRFNRRFAPMAAFNSVLGIGVRVTAPTYEELYSGEWEHSDMGQAS